MWFRDESFENHAAGKSKRLPVALEQAYAIETAAGGPKYPPKKAPEKITTPSQQTQKSKKRKVGASAYVPSADKTRLYCQGCRCMHASDDTLHQFKRKPVRAQAIAVIPVLEYF